MDGYGSVVVPLLNLRQDYVFKCVAITHHVALIFGRYYSGNMFDLAALSNIVSFANVNEPTQLHLAVTGVVTEMRVMWCVD